MKQTVYYKKSSAGANAHKPDMDDGVKTGAASFGKEKISAIEKTCGQRHGISDPKPGMKQEVCPHDQRRTKERYSQTAPKGRGESLLQDQPGSQGNPQRSRIA